MSIDRDDGLWGHARAGGAYRGFSAAPAIAPSPPSASPTWRIPRAATIVGGVAAALALGLAFGFFAKPDLGPTDIATPMRAAPAAAPASGTVAIEVNAPTPPRPVKSAGKLEVLSPDLARSAPRPTPVSAPLAVQSSAPIALPTPRTASLDPACAGGRAAQMVCADPDLAAADQALNRAYRRAMRAGVPPEQLRRDQRDWLAAREDAARRSPRAVAEAYDQRIDELNDQADEGPG